MKSKLNREKEAIAFRDENALGSEEPIKIKNLLTNLKVQTFFKPISENISGMSIKINDLRYMLINSNHSIGRQNFTIFHEIYHLFIQENFASMVCATGHFDKSNTIEFYADWFSAFVLLPRDGIINRVPKAELSKNKISLNTILALEHYFSCSRAALLRRLEELNLIDNHKYLHYKENIKLSANQYGYDTSLYEPGRHNKVITNYGIVARELYDKEIISESNYISLMGDVGIDVESGDYEYGTTS